MRLMICTTRVTHIRCELELSLIGIVRPTSFCVRTTLSKREYVETYKGLFVFISTFKRRKMPLNVVILPTYTLCMTSLQHVLQVRTRQKGASHQKNMLLFAFEDHWLLTYFSANAISNRETIWPATTWQQLSLTWIFFLL